MSLQIYYSLLFSEAEGIQRAGDVYVCPVALIAHCRISSTLFCVRNFWNNCTAIVTSVNAMRFCVLHILFANEALADFDGTAK